MFKAMKVCLVSVTVMAVVVFVILTPIGQSLNEEIYS